MGKCYLSTKSICTIGTIFFFIRFSILAKNIRSLPELEILLNIVEERECEVFVPLGFYFWIIDFDCFIYFECSMPFMFSFLRIYNTASGNMPISFFLFLWIPLILSNFPGNERI